MKLQLIQDSIPTSIQPQSEDEADPALHFTADTRLGRNSDAEAQRANYTFHCKMAEELCSAVSTLLRTKLRITLGKLG